MFFDDMSDSRLGRYHDMWVRLTCHVDYHERLAQIRSEIDRRERLRTQRAIPWKKAGF